MNKKGLSLFERYLTKEIGIEFKACLYFFCILFFYCVYRLLCGFTEARIIHMLEMIVLTYAMGYIQVYLLSNFDEAEQLGIRELFFMLAGAAVYALSAYWGSWFDRSIGVGILFLCYMSFAYVCAFLVYKFKRIIDAKLLNEDLKHFQERKSSDEESNRNQ